MRPIRLLPTLWLMSSTIPADACHLDAALLDLPPTARVARLEVCAEQGHALALLVLADQYLHGEGLPRDTARAADYYRRAAEAGIPRAQLQYGIMLLDGEGVTQDSSEALEWIFRARQQGYGPAGEVFDYLMAHPEPLDR